MKWLGYLMAFAVAMLAPVKRADVGKLQPVEVIYLYMEEGVVIETDTGDTGRGETVDEAVANLKQTTPGIVYLDTAEYLLLDQEAENVLQQIKNHLEANIRVCYLQGNPELSDAARFLDVHRPESTLDKWGMERKQWLVDQNGCLTLK